MTIIRRADFPADLSAVLSIWREYVTSPSVSLDYQDNETEFSTLPGKYAAPKGCVLLANRGSEIDGCSAFRAFSIDICEMKRLYVRPQARGSNLGSELLRRLTTEARIAGYREIRLNVLEEFTAARRLYERFGFVPAEPISFNPVPSTSFLGLHL